MVGDEAKYAAFAKIPANARYKPYVINQNNKAQPICLMKKTVENRKVKDKKREKSLFGIAGQLTGVSSKNVLHPNTYPFPNCTKTNKFKES